MKICNHASRIAIVFLLPSVAIALKIAAALSVIEWTPQKIAAEDFADDILGGNVTFVGGGVPVLFSDPTVDLATNAETQALRVFPTNSTLRIIYTIAEVAYRLVVDKRKVQTLSDLKGKRIGTYNNTSGAYFVRKLLESAGLKTSDYTVVTGLYCNIEPCANTTLPAILRAGLIDAVALWEPTVELSSRVIGEEHSRFFSDFNVYREIFSLHSTTEKLSDPTKRKEIVSFVKALERALDLARHSPEKVIPRAAEAMVPKTEAELLEKVWHHHQWTGKIPEDIVDVLVEEDREFVSKEQNRTALSRKKLRKLVDYSIQKEVWGDD